MSQFINIVIIESMLLNFKKKITIQMPKINIIDVSSFLYLEMHDQPVKDSLQYYGQLCKSQNTYSMGSFGSQQLHRSSSMAKGLPKGHKNVKRNKLVYEIVDNKRVIIYRNSNSASSFNFDYIQESKCQSNYLANWVCLQTSSCQQHMDFKLNFKLVLAHNYELQDCLSFIGSIGKKLLHEGLSFRIKTCSHRNQDQNNAFHKIQERKPAVRFQFNQNRSQLSKNIKFLSQLKQYVSNLKNLSDSIEQIWIICNSFQIGFGVYQSQKNSYGIKLLEKLIAQSESNFGIDSYNKNSQYINISVAISSICQSPQQNNVQKCKKVLQQALILRNSINQYATIQKPFHSSRSDISVNESSQRRKLSKKYQQEDNFQNNQSSKALRQISNQNKTTSFERKKSRKNSRSNLIKNQVENTIDRRDRQSIHFIKVKKSKQNRKPSQQQVSSDQQLVFQQSSKLVKQNNLQNSQTNITNIMAENIHLKWQLKTMQQQYQIQSQKFILKTEKKYKDMMEQRTFCLQENGRLRKDNEQLLKQINSLKFQYDTILKTRADYQLDLKQKNIQNQLSLTVNYGDKLKQLQQKLRNLDLQNKNLIKNSNDLKANLDDARRRYKQRISQMTQELDNYKKFCEQFKVAYDDLEAQSRLDQDRCQNLEKRCKKYQQSLSDLLKLKMSSQSQSSQSKYSSIESSQIIGKAEQIVKQQEQQPFTLRNRTQQLSSVKLRQQFDNMQGRVRRGIQHNERKNKQKSLHEGLNAQLKSKLSMKRDQTAKKQQSSRNKTKEKAKAGSLQISSQMESELHENKNIKKQRLLSFGDSYNKFK